MKTTIWTRWCVAVLVVGCAALWMGWRVAQSTADEPKLAVLSDLRDAVQMAERRGANVTEIREALDQLEKALQQGLKVEPGQTDPPRELVALREAVEAAARKGENVDGIRKELEAVERKLIGRTLQMERPREQPVEPPRDPNRPRRPPFLPPGDGDFPIPPGLVMPRLPGNLPGIDRELFDKAQKLREEAFRKLLDNPNDPEALKQLEEATQLMLQAIGGPNLRQFPFDPMPLPLFPNPDLPPNQRPRLGVRMERVPEALADQLGLEAGRGILITDVLPDTPADKAGFKPHDIVLEFAGKPVSDNPEAFARLVQETKAGEKVTAVVLRKGKRVELKDITLPETKRDERRRRMPDDPQDHGIVPGVFDGFPFSGIDPDFGPPALPGIAGGAKARIVSVAGVNGKITLKAVDNGVQYTIHAVQDDLKPIEKITIVDGDNKFEADEVSKVPEKYRPVVKELIQQYLSFPLGGRGERPKD